MSSLIDEGEGKIIILFVSSDGIFINFEYLFSLTSPFLNFIPFQLINPSKGAYFKTYSIPGVLTM